MYAAKILNRWNTKQVAFEHIFVGAVFFLFWNPCAAKFHTSHTCTFEAIRELGIWQHHCDPCFPHHPTGFCGPAVICPVVLGRDWHGKLQFNCLWWKSLFKYQWFHFFNLFVLAWCHQTRFRLTHMAVRGQSPASKSNPGFGIQCVYFGSFNACDWMRRWKSGKWQAQFLWGTCSPLFLLDEVWTQPSLPGPNIWEAVSRVSSNPKWLNESKCFGFWMIWVKSWLCLLPLVCFIMLNIYIYVWCCFCLRDMGVTQLSD